MFCNKGELSSAGSSATLVPKTHRPKQPITNNKLTAESPIPARTSDVSKKLCVNATTSFINRGGGDCAANDILNREFPKVKVNNCEAMIVLLCEKNSHPFQTRIIPLMPLTQCTVGRISSKCRASDSNAFFDCKVLSRTQAKIWYDDDERKFWIKDTESSNGTYLNGSKLNDEAIQLHSGDVIQLGVNVYENKCSEVHNCIVASVQLHLPNVKSEKYGDHCDHSEASKNSKNFTQMLQVSGGGDGGGDCVEEQHDLCETSRTTVETGDTPGDRPKSTRSTKNRVSDNACYNCINLKDEQTNETVKVQLHSIESFIEAIRNSTLDAWESISEEDSYLQRINTLQNKISILKKTTNDEELKIEKQQWQNESQLYKRTAKDALRHVSLECKDIMLKIGQVETKYKSLENECEMLRDQIDAKDQSINDFSCLLRHIEIDYDEYKTEMQTKNEKSNIKLEKTLNSLKEQLEKLEIERDQLSKKLEELITLEAEHVESETDVEIREQCNKLEDTKGTLDNTIEVVEKFQQLDKMLNGLERQDDEIEFELEDMQKFYNKNVNFVKFKETYIELLQQYKELQRLLVNKEKFKLESDTCPKDVISTKSIATSTNESIEEDIFDDYNHLEAELEDLQAQLIDQELNTEQIFETLENECDSYRKQFEELQQENLSLLSQQKKLKELNEFHPEKESTEVIAIKIDETTETEDYEAVLKDLKTEFSHDMNEKFNHLTETEEQLAAYKGLFNESQEETFKLQEELIQMTQKQTLKQKNQPQSLKLLPILVPIFLGLIGMFAYLAAKLLF